MVLAGVPLVREYVTLAVLLGRVTEYVVGSTLIPSELVASVTTIAVHEPQLSLSLLSVMTPSFPAELLSAQERT